MALKKEKAMGPQWLPMASIPPSGLDLRATLAKIKIKEIKVKHFVSLKPHYKT
jgi:hypothetical protein